MIARSRPFVFSVLLFALLAAPRAHAQSVDCTGVAAYSATTIYNVGDKMTYQGVLYAANISIWNAPPNYCPSCGWYTTLGTCGSAPATCTTLPGAPSGLASSNVSSTGTSLSWSAPSAGANCTISSYVVYQGGSQVATPTGTSASITGLSASTTYSFTVAAKNAYGTGPQSSPLSVTTSSPATCNTLPGAPSGLASSNVTTSSTSLSWSAPSAGANCTISSYVVYRGDSQVATPTGTSTSITGLSASTTYLFTVAAKNAYGTGPKSSPLSVTTSSPAVCSTLPGAPSGLTSSNITSSSASLSWSAPSAGANCTISSYVVYQNGSQAATPSGTSASISGLSASTTYSFTVAAKNAYGTGSPSSALSVTTSAGGSSSLPKHVLTGYWHNFTNGSKVLRLSDVPAAYDLIAVAFGVANSTPGGVSFAVDPDVSSALGGYSDAQFKADIQTLHGQGRKVILSVGGANGFISVADDSAAATFANNVYAYMQSYGFDGVDIDLENGVNPTYMSSALHQLASKAGSSLIITMAPETAYMQSTGMTYFQLALNIKDILTIVNMQYYNSGTMNGCDGNVYSEGTENFLTGLACIQLQNGLRPDQIGLGLPATSAAGAGYVDPSMVNAALDCLELGTSCGSFKPSKTYPGVRGAMTWSINWDATNGYNWANTIKPHLTNLP